MEKHDKDFLQTFDALYTTNQIQIMKILLPYCNPDSRRGLAVMIKFMEFDYTLRFAADGKDSAPESGQDGEKAGNNPFSAGGMNPMDMLMGMLSPDQQSMFQMFQSDFNTEAASTGNTDMQDSPPEREQ